MITPAINIYYYTTFRIIALPEPLVGCGEIVNLDMTLAHFRRSYQDRFGHIADIFRRSVYMSPPAYNADNTGNQLTSTYSAMIVGNLGAPLRLPSDVYDPNEKEDVIYVASDPLLVGLDTTTFGASELYITYRVNRVRFLFRQPFRHRYQGEQ
ncbi:hypothetical protein QCA50_011247 [Cerrena zonata]|uniref:Uncharacterized protein n=1 Tax=Cerrena zonata TaxID=2478898 RepID=A0AAW0G220_9APHY